MSGAVSNTWAHSSTFHFHLSHKHQKHRLNQKVYKRQDRQATCLGLSLSHLDYSNSILCGLPANSVKPLQRVQNQAARVVLNQSRYDSAKLALKELHWLPIHERVDLKVACLVFQCIPDQASSTLSSTLAVKSFARQTRADSTALQLLEIPKTKKKDLRTTGFQCLQNGGMELSATFPDSCPWF